VTQILSRVANNPTLVNTDSDLKLNKPELKVDVNRDKVAAVGGSWAFIIGFSLFLVLWAALNTIVLANRAFDPFPFIFLNLMLSMVAALQAPIIMMSQNRQAKKDRIEARIDYETNAHAAGEIALVQEKLDVLIGILISDKSVRASVLDLIERSKVN